MSTTPSPTQSFLTDDLPIEAPSEEPQSEKGQPSLGRRTWLTAIVATGVSVIAILAWQSYGDAAREKLAPAKEISPDLQTMRQSIDALATSTATNQAHLMRSIDELAAGQEQITREIVKLQEIEQNILSKTSDHPLQPAPAPVSKPVLRPSQVRTTLTHAKSP